jgi:predicted O-methyltransferase YrrM
MMRTSMLSKAATTLVDEGPTAVAVKAARRARFVVDIGIATWMLRRAARRANDIEESLDLAFGFSVGQVTIAPAQIRAEIEALLGRLAADPPRNVLEIGTARGGTLFLLSRVASADARLASIDLPGGEFGGGYERMRAPLLRTFCRERQTLKLIRADSHDDRTHEEVRRWLAGRLLDFLLIDGDHSFEGIRSDLVTYGPLVRAGGLIAIHDIVSGPPDWVGGVPCFWPIVKHVYETKELVDDFEQRGSGIGLVIVPPGGIEPDQLVRKTLDCGSATEGRRQAQPPEC